MRAPKTIAAVKPSKADERSEKTENGSRQSCREPRENDLRWLTCIPSYPQADEHDRGINEGKNQHAAKRRKIMSKARERFHLSPPTLRQRDAASCLFDHFAEREQGLFVEGATNQLQAERQTFG